MSRAKTERLLNLTICLLATRRFLTREQVRRLVPGYPEGDEAFERMFERDKDELREMGVPLQTGPVDPFFDDELGYRIDPNAYALPEVDFDPEELAVLALAAQAWQQASLAGAAGRALLKLQASGADPDLEAVAPVQPRVGGSEPAFLPLWEAVRDRTPVRFGYRRSGDDEPTQRRVEPWGVVSWHGHWYLVGLDRDRGAERVFRVDRVAGPVARAGRPGEVRVPEGVDLRRVVDGWAGPREVRGQAQVLVRTGTGAGLRRQADQVAPAPDRPGWDLLQIPFGDPDAAASTVLALGSDAVVLGPEEVRAAVLAGLRGVLAAPGEDS